MRDYVLVFIITGSDQYEGLDDGLDEVKPWSRFPSLFLSRSAFFLTDGMKYLMSSDAIEGADVMLYSVSLACECRNLAATI